MRTNEQEAMKVSWRSMLVNVALSAFKLAAGIIGRSTAMVSDAVHSMSDVLSTIIVMVGVKMANKQSDKEHPYGHERLECVAAILLSAALLATGGGIGYAGLLKVAKRSYGDLTAPGILPLVAAVLSIVVKEGMFWYTMAAAKRIDSSALRADAWHHRSDALSSIGSFAGILGARMGFSILDPVASVLICAFIVKASLEIFIDAIGKMTDRSCDDRTVEQIRSVILEQRDVLDIDQVKTRLFGDKIYVDVEISANGDATLHETHETAQRVHDAIEASFPKVKHCMVHVNPADDE
ncbi:MAG: cation diffusion facilitator family transporter [Synergistaceae bacterium]|jgi:cation diffusion facilitator family transporter|nr:cation diffusion facilitator family transporter [Synergistaceae bacterium]